MYNGSGSWGRSLLDLVAILQELASLEVGFVSLSEALDLTTPSGRPRQGCLRSSPSSEYRGEMVPFSSKLVAKLEAEHASRASADADLLSSMRTLARAPAIKAGK